MSSLFNLKRIFKESLDQMEDNASFTSPFNTKKSKILKRLIDKNVNDIYQLGLLTNFQFPQHTLLFDKIEKFSDPNPLKYLFFNNSSAPREWWFYYGISNSSTMSAATPMFVVCLFRVGITRDTSIYNLFLGYTNTAGTWLTPKSSYGNLLPNINNDLNIIYKGYDGNNFHTLTLNMDISNNKMDIIYTNTDTKLPKMHAILNIKNGDMPTYNGPGGCDPICFDGIGSLYWSYTNLEFFEYEVENKPLQIVNGWGWFDHQLLSSGTPHTFLGRIIEGITEKSYKPARWLWTTAKIDDNLQYQYHTTIDTYPAKVGDVFDCSINYYTKDKIVYFIDGKTTIKTVISLNPPESYSKTFHIPVVYTISYTDDAGNHNYTFSAFTLNAGNYQGMIYTAGGTVNWECAGTWYDDTNSKSGLAFLEANNCHTTEEAIDINNSAGKFELNDDDKHNLEPEEAVSKGRVYFLVIFIVLLLAFLTIQIVCLFKKDGKWCCSLKSSPNDAPWYS